jgi:hypothetical protein
MGDISERGLRDPVSEGIVDIGQLEAAYQVWVVALPHLAMGKIP